MPKSDLNHWLTVFGLLIDRRIFLFLKSSRSWAIIPYQPQVPLLFFGLSLLIFLFRFESVAVGFVLQVIMMVGMIGFRFQLLQRQESRLRQSFHGWMENLLLRMKMGASFRSAFHSCTETCSDLQLRSLLARQEVGFQMKREMSTVLPLSSCPVPFFREVFQRISEIEAVPHRAQARMESLILTWRQELWFRRRSRQVRRQSQVQLSFLGMMYLILVIWSAQRYPLSRFWPALRVSTALILVGVVIILLLHRGRKWTI